jgi:hypothetical protein
MTSAAQDRTGVPVAASAGARRLTRVPASVGEPGPGHGEQAQHGFGELVDGGPGNAFRVPLAHPQQPGRAACRGAERDSGTRQTAARLPKLAVQAR